MKQYNVLIQIPCCGAALWLYRLEYLRTICSAISVKPHGMVQPITAAVLESFVMTNKDGAHHHRHAGFFFEGIWNNYVDIQDINM